MPKSKHRRKPGGKAVSRPGRFAKGRPVTLDHLRDAAGNDRSIGLCGGSTQRRLSWFQPDCSQVWPLLAQAREERATLSARVAALSPEEQTVVRVAQRVDVLLSNLDVEGACYRATCFLHLFLQEAHGLKGEPVVGFVNDGTDDLYPSHAWFEFNGKPTDLALCRPLHEVAPAPLLIQGIEFRQGHRWTYHRDRPEAGTREIQRLLRNPAWVEFVRDADETHHRMVATVRDDRAIREYLDAAPDGWTYAKMAVSIR